MNKVIIIGGGISGLTAGIYAQKNGFQSEIYEKNNICGGECTGWYKDGFHIDNCIQWLTGASRSNPLYKVWNEVDALGDNIPVFKFEELYSIKTNEITLHFWKDLNRLREDLLYISYEDKIEIERLIDAIIMLQKLEMIVDKPFDLMTISERINELKKLSSISKIYNRYQKITIEEYANKFKHSAIRDLLTSYIPLKYSAFSLIFSFANFCSENGVIPKGGSLALARRMTNKYISLGGKINLNHSAEKIIVKDSYATEIIFNNGKKISGDYIICACDTYETFSKLIGYKYIDNTFKKLYKNRDKFPVSSSINISFGVDDNCDYIPKTYIFECKEYLVLDKKYNKLTLMNYNYDNIFAPKGKCVLQCSITQLEDDCDKWIEISKDRLLYSIEKNNILKNITNIILNEFPMLKGKIKNLDIITPASYYKRCNAFKGAYMGFMMTPQWKNKILTGKVKEIKNLFLTGQWIQSPGGIPTALITGKYTIQRIIKKNLEGY